MSYPKVGGVMIFYILFPFVHTVYINLISSTFYSDLKPSSLLSPSTAEIFNDTLMMMLSAYGAVATIFLVFFNVHYRKCLYGKLQDFAK
uniref:ABC transporter permease n=1 Tax=Heterorhabditis bacteriophora TaxID=37862 RepID=A0A1I7WLU6_HETBA